MALVIEKGHRFAPRTRAVVLGVVIAIGCAACKTKSDRATAYTSVDQVFSEPMFRHCGKVRGLFDTEETKSTGVVNRLIAEAKRPQADVFWSGDPVRPFVLMDAGLVQPYVSPQAKAIPDVFRAADGAWTGFAARARVLLVNTKLVTESELPRSIHDLAAPRWKAKTSIANPLFGTTTMHVAALFEAWGDEKAKAYLAKLKQNDVRIASSNGEVKRLVVSGESAFGLTDTDDAHQAVAGGAPVRIVYPDQRSMGTLVMPTVVVLIKNGPNPAAGKRLIDCLLSAEVESHMAKAAAHMPLRAKVSVPKHVRAVDGIKAMKVDYASVAKTMVRIQPWLRSWAGS